MTNVIASSWTTDVNGSYATAADWTPNGVPTFGGGNEFDVYIGGAATSGSAAFTVTSAASEQIGFLDIGANATLAITGGQFLVYSHVNAYSNAYNYGTITVAAGASLRFGMAGSPSNATSEINNVGTISIGGSLALAAPWFGLFGAGALNLSGNILGANGSAIAELENEASTINGSGAIGTGATLKLVNANGGLINANASAALSINTGANTVYDEGTIETTGAGGLAIHSSLQLDGVLAAAGTGALSLIGAQAHGGGQATVASGASMTLNSGQLNMSGLISVASGGAIRTFAGNTTGVGVNNTLVGDAITDGEVEDAGSIVVTNNSTLNLNATIYNSGLLSIAGTTGPTKLEVFSSGLTILNAAGIVMSNSAQNAIVSNGAGTVLINDTRIIGAGTIGDGYLRVTNHLGATIQANDSLALTIVADTSAVANGSEAENFNNGTILSSGAGGLVFSGGTLSNAGYITEDGAGAMTLKGVAIDNGGGIVRTIAGTIVLQGNAQIYNQTDVAVAAGATIQTTAGDTGDAIYSQLFNSGSINVTAGSTLGVDGHWTNTASVNVGSASSAATVKILAANTWELLGAGALNMSNAADAILSSGAGARLEDKGNLIVGGGVIGDANMEVDILLGAKVDATLAGGMVLNATAMNTSTGQTYLYNAGTIQSDSAAGVTLEAAAYSSGQLIANAGAKIFAAAAVYGAGATTINGTGSVEFAAEADNSVHFGATTGGDLILDASHQFFGHIYGLAAGDMVDLRDFAFVAGSTGVDNATSGFGSLDGALYVTNGTTDSAALLLQGNYTSAYLTANHLAFQFASDGHVISGSTDGTLVKLVSTS